MENFTPNTGLASASAGGEQPVWRPWTGTGPDTDAHHAPSLHGVFSLVRLLKAPQFVHPVKLFWPRSRCFDYLYREAETLLRNYPVQATICLYEDSSSDEEGDDEEEEVEKEPN